MMLSALLTTLVSHGALPASRAKDCKTSLRYLAEALGQESLETCPVDTACREDATWAQALETHFATLEARGKTLSAATRRNTRNNVRVIFRLAEAHGLLTAPLPPRLLTKPPRLAFERQQRATAPYQTTYALRTGPRHFGLPQAQWPPEIAQGWQTYQALAALRLRETTLKNYARYLTIYFGYLMHVGGRTPAWEDLFDTAQLTAFVTWHGARVGRPISAYGRNVVIAIAAMARVLKHEKALALADLRNTLKAPEPLHIKHQHTVSLRELEAVADACLAEGRAPYIARANNRHPGRRHAAHFQKGVILKLLVRVPLRQRNVREMQLGKHLYKDQTTGHWWLHFRGSDLKIGTRQGRVNEYKMNLTEVYPEFIGVLEEWLRDHRPRLRNAETAPQCFLTWGGKPFTAKSLGVELSVAVAMRTGKRWYPHLIRTTWPTEYLTDDDDDDKPDWITAAVMLGDKVATVMAYYHDLVDSAHHPKGAAFVAKSLHAG